MLKQTRVLLIAAALGSVIPIILWLHYAAFGDDPAFVFDFGDMVVLTSGFLMPAAFIASFIGIKALHERLRAPDVVVTVTARATPLMAKFLEQDRRLERRERLKGELFRLNGEIETFAAELTPDERESWAKRPGPYGK